MTRRAIFLLALLPALRGGQTLDRIAVTIGRHVLAESEIVADLRVDAFIDGRAPDLSGEAKRKSADRLIDQYLVLEDADSLHAALPGPANAEPLLEPIKARYASEADYRAALARAGITEMQLSEHLLNGLRMLRYTDVRFRPEVQISDADLHEYFDMLVAEQKVKNPSQPPPDFEESRDEIEKLLTDQRVMQTLDRWLGMVRTQTQILYRDAVFK